MNGVLIDKSDLTLKFKYKTPEKSLAYKNTDDPLEWQDRCRAKLRELIAAEIELNGRAVETHRSTETDFCAAYSLIMRVDENLTLPGYLLVPNEIKYETPVLALHGHALDVKGVFGITDDYHHGFGAELCRAGFVTLIPELRGFGSLVNLAEGDNRKLIYYNWGEIMAYTLVTDAFSKGRTLIGDTIGDLFAWGSYLCEFEKRKNYSAAGISYGGDLALILAAIDEKILKTFASGTLGSMEIIFDTAYNAPAHCIPGILKYMDRQEIAQCVAPRSLAVHYGGLDTPSPQNFSAAFNETAIPAFNEVKKFYKLMGADDKLQLIVSPDMGHEMENEALINFLCEE